MADLLVMVRVSAASPPSPGSTPGRLAWASSTGSTEARCGRWSRSGRTGGRWAGLGGCQPGGGDGGRFSRDWVGGAWRGGAVVPD